MSEKKDGKITPNQLVARVISAARDAETSGYLDESWLDAQETHRAILVLVQGFKELYLGDDGQLNDPHIPVVHADEIVAAALHIPRLSGVPVEVGRTNDGWGVLSREDKPWKRKLYRPNPRLLMDGLDRARMIPNERYPDTRGILELVNGYTVNKRVRLVPQTPGVAVSHGNSVEMDGYSTLENLPLMFKISREHAQRISYVIENAQRSGQELVICIPTCPCDPVQTCDGDFAIKFSGGALVNGVSWTALNTVDALAVLLPGFLERVSPEQRVRLVFAFGDFEFGSGSTRGMSEHDFHAMFERNAQTLDAYVRERLDLDSYGSRIELDVRGMMSLVGGREGWDCARSRLRDDVRAYFATAPDDVIEKLIGVRRTIYETLRGQTLSQEELIECLQSDVLDYCVGDRAFQDMFDSSGRTSFVLAGDSRSMHVLASKVTDAILLSINGGYQGSL